MKHIDLHVHTDASTCSNAKPREVVASAIEAGLDGIAITNHNTLDGYYAANKVAPHTLDVIPGVEVSTTEGHILGIDVDSVPPKGDPLTVIEEIQDRGGLAILAHPFDRFRHYFSTDIERLARRADGVEIANSRCLLDTFNDKALRYSSNRDVAITGGSDAHFPIEVGRCYTVVPEELHSSITQRSTSSYGRGRYLSGHFLTKIHEFQSIIY